MGDWFDGVGELLGDWFTYDAARDDAAREREARDAAARQQREAREAQVILQRGDASFQNKTIMLVAGAVALFMLLRVVR